MEYMLVGDHGTRRHFVVAEVGKTIRRNEVAQPNGLFR